MSYSTIILGPWVWFLPSFMVSMAFVGSLRELALASGSAILDESRRAVDWDILSKDELTVLLFVKSKACKFNFCVSFSELVH